MAGRSAGSVTAVKRPVRPPKEAPPARRRRHGRPSNDEADQISNVLMEAATREFVEHGFRGASLDRIAKAAHTFKTTIYRRYATKAALFEGVLLREGRMFTERYIHDVDCSRPVEEVLETMALGLLEQAFRPDSRAIFALVLAESRRFPELAQSCTDSWMENGITEVKKQLDRLVGQKKLKIGDTRRAAYWFIALAVPGFIVPNGSPSFFQVPGKDGKSGFRRIAQEAARMFLAAARPDPDVFSA
jgi:AcrR family transcriptional regulator